MSEELKPCPFCGRAMVRAKSDAAYVHPEARCAGDLTVLMDAYPDQVRQWNAVPRAPVLREETMADVAEVLEALESWNQDVPIWSDEHMLDAALMAFRKVSEELKP